MVPDKDDAGGHGRPRLIEDDLSVLEPPVPPRSAHVHDEINSLATYRIEYSCTSDVQEDHSPSRFQ